MHNGCLTWDLLVPHQRAPSPKSDSVTHENYQRPPPPATVLDRPHSHMPQGRLRFPAVTNMTLIEQRYQARIDAMSPAERMARASSLFSWVRENIARQIVAESGPVAPEVLKWRVALRLYGDDPVTRRMIEEKLASVADLFPPVLSRPAEDVRALRTLVDDILPDHEENLN